jgi:diguanylate cyclase (GGDEF)-like protein/PAS domain S-box-containing protein
LRKLSQALEQTAESVFITDLNGRIEYANPAFTRLSGYSAREVLGQTPSLIKSGQNDPAYFQRMWGILLSGETFRDTVVNRRKDGVLFFEEKTISPLTENGGLITHFVSTGHDVSERVRGEETRNRLVSILEATPDFVATTDAEARLLYLNQAGRHMLGLGPQHDISGMRLVDCMSEWGAQQLLRVALPTAARDGVWEGESMLRSESEHGLSVSQVLLAHRDANDDIAFYSTIARDISERMQYEEELRHQATHDMLTGLPNRTLLDDRLEAEIKGAIRQHRKFALVFLDLDNFKRVNDSLGHPAGDTLLREVSMRLRRCMRPNDTVARYGGDEFVVVGGNLASVEHVLVVINKLREAFLAPVHVAEREIFITFSAGIALYPSDGENSETLLKNADTAMFRAKDAGQGQFRFYAGDMNARGRELLDMDTALRRALERVEFQIYYQPQKDLRSDRIIGAEALIRWQRPNRDQMVMPIEFVPLLEETGLILPVGEWVLRTACAQWRDYRASGGAPQRIAVNVSARQFSDRGLVDMVARVLEEENMRADALEIEITESTVMQDIDLAGYTLAALAKLGVRLAVDDFGTGYSSLAYLKRFPINTLKIDASFIRNLPQDSDDASITEASISLGHKLGLEVLAEGVENLAQYDYLRAHECDLIQGYYLSRPLPAERAISFMSQ